MAEAVKRGDKTLQKALREKTIRVHVNSPHVHSLVEVLKSPEVLFKSSVPFFNLIRSPANRYLTSLKKRSSQKKALRSIGE